MNEWVTHTWMNELQTPHMHKRFSLFMSDTRHSCQMWCRDPHETLCQIPDSHVSCQIRHSHVSCDVETLTRLCVRYDPLMSHVRYETRMSHVRYDSHDSWDESCDMWHVTCQMTCLSCKDPHETLMSDIIGWFVHWDTEGIEPTREQAPVSYGLRP